jgi:hypothetical protein
MHAFAYLLFFRDAGQGRQFSGTLAPDPLCHFPGRGIRSGVLRFGWFGLVRIIPES